MRHYTTIKASVYSGLSLKNCRVSHDTSAHVSLVYPEACLEPGRKALEGNHERPALRQAQGERIGGTHFKGDRPIGTRSLLFQLYGLNSYAGRSFRTSFSDGEGGLCPFSRENVRLDGVDLTAGTTVVIPPAADERGIFGGKE